MSERIVKTTRWFKLELECPVAEYGNRTDDEVILMESFRFGTEDIQDFAGLIKHVELDVQIVTVKR